MKLVKALLLVTVTLIMTGCINRQAPTPAPTDEQPSQQDESSTNTGALLTAHPQEFDAKITNRLNQATNAAHAKFADAKLVYFEITLSLDLEPEQGREIYVFRSEKIPDEWWTYSFDQSTGKSVRAIIPKEDYLGFDNLNPIQTQYWTTNYIEAFQIAEDNGGKIWRQDNTVTQIKLVIMHRQPRGWLWWTVEYTNSAENSLVRLINANADRQEVLDENFKEIAPPKGVTAESNTQIN